MTSRRVRLRAAYTPDGGWYGCIEDRRDPRRGAPLGPVSDRIACALVLASALPNEHLSIAAARMNVPALPAGLEAR